MRKTQTFKPHDEKLKQLILYVAEESKDDPHFGSTKLNKILYFADFVAYRDLGKPITGHEYQRLKRGPAPRKMLPIIQSMQDDGQLVVEEKLVHGNYPQKRPVNRVSPDLSEFSAGELNVVDYVIEKLKPMNAADVSTLSHIRGGWKFANDGQTIPYESVYVDNSELTAEEEARGREVARDHALLDG